MAATRFDLPLELVSQILTSSHPSHSQLAVFSKVCHRWYQIVFPVLYHTVCLSWNAPIFAARILDEDLTLVQNASSSALGLDQIPLPIDGLRVADHVQALVLDARMQREVPILQPLEESMVHVAFLLLKRLKRVDWSLPFLPRDMRFFSYMSFRCCEIEYISFDVGDYSNFNGALSDDALDCLFAFSGLKHIRIKDTRLPYDPGTNGRLAPGLVKMILRSPNLEYLELDLRENPQDESFLSFGWLVEAITPVLRHNFENLKVFRLGGTASIDSEFIFNPGEESLVRDFLFRHPGLHTLQLPWDWEMNNLVREPLDRASEALRGALPNLRRFEGPAYLVMVILRLEIAQRLEHLVVLDTMEDEDYNLAAFAASFAPLPNLQHLAFMSTYMLDNRTFARVLSATPNITELTVQWVDGDPEITVQALAELKYLQILTVGFNLIPHLAHRSRQDVCMEQETDEVAQLASLCTSLELVQILPEESSGASFNYNARWRITRFHHQAIDVAFSSLRKLPTIKADLLVDPQVCSRRYTLSIQ